MSGEGWHLSISLRRYINPEPTQLAGHHAFQTDQLVEIDGLALKRLLAAKLTECSSTQQRPGSPLA